ncbi:MAG: rRNA ((1402)-N(4))-methyltransferase RsmH [Chloroflexi bacterium]|nr:rRNA ((1402)-N(4))-methyltransferase RsmH [Chloroflexota bacterium]
MASVEHVPVLYRETLQGLALRPGGRYIDSTAGSGGHAAGILEASGPDGTLLALDTDPEAIERTRTRLQPYGERARVVQSNFRDLEATAKREGWEQVDGILFDLGVSSVQLGVARRGFSFQAEGPLDMRMDPTRGPSAADLVNDLGEQELADLIRQYGEEPQAKRIAAAIVRARASRRIETTAQLADLVAQTKGRRGRIHPATTVFQALRIAVNGELDSITLALPQAVRLLRPGGRLAVIAFHSLEDRIVKRFLHEEAKECRCPPRQPVCTCDRQPILRLLSRHAVMPEPGEVEANPRARSARLRVAERL